MKSLTLAHLVLGASPAENIAAAAAAGFGAVGLRVCARRPTEPFATPLLGDPAAARSLRQQARDAGIVLSNVSGYQFYPDVTWDHVAPVIETTDALGAATVVVNGFDPDASRFDTLFTRYCAAAADAGINVALEFLPYSAIRTLDAAVRVIERTGAPNAGILLDALHLERSGGSPADITRMAPGHIAFAQLCDANRLTGPRSDAELLIEARTARLPAGEGELPLFEFLDALPEGTEIEYEVARADLQQGSALDKALAAHRDAARFMEAWQAHRASRTGRAMP